MWRNSRPNLSLKSDDVGMGEKVQDDRAPAQQHQTGVRFLADDRHNWHQGVNSPQANVQTIGQTHTTSPRPLYLRFFMR